MCSRMSDMGNKEIMEKVPRGYRLSNPNGSILGSGVTGGFNAKVFCPDPLYQVGHFIICR